MGEESSMYQRFLYILENGKQAYIGESNHVKNRMSQHHSSVDKRIFDKVHFIYSSKFNQSVTFDYESKLIQYIVADELYEVRNKNAGMADKEYYGKLSGENDVYADRPSRAQLRYIDSVVSGVANREEELNAQISKFAIGWDISRISKLARCILQLAIYEILYVEDVPTGVAVSEAVRIAKKYDGDDTGSFVNGILGSFARSLTAPAAEAAE